MARFLVEEDEPPVRSVIKETLDGQGYQIIEAANGAQSYEMTAEVPLAERLGMKGIIILGVIVFFLGVILIVSGYGSSTTFLVFGVFFVLVGGLFVVVLPMLTLPLPQNNTPSNRPAAPGLLSTQEREELQRKVDQLRGSINRSASARTPRSGQI